MFTTKQKMPERYLKSKETNKQISEQARMNQAIKDFEKRTLKGLFGKNPSTIQQKIIRIALYPSRIKSRINSKISKYKFKIMMEIGQNLCKFMSKTYTLFKKKDAKSAKKIQERFIAYHKKKSKKLKGANRDFYDAHLNVVNEVMKYLFD
ncbi:hypothetical protein GF369_03605 [Candidatus Peregrinibacteria bacterium]|nr:hypothetical protein [Candidatus Peregrinibacteria bacterium]